MTEHDHVISNGPRSVGDVFTTIAREQRAVSKNKHVHGIALCAAARSQSAAYLESGSRIGPVLARSARRWSRRW
jgi:hypothetical protein